MSPRQPIVLGSVLRAVRMAHPADVPEVVTSVAHAAVGGTDVVVYLADFGQEILEPLVDRSAHLHAPEAEPVSASIAGRAFTQHRAFTAERPEGTRIWAPVVEGSDVTGILAVTVREADEATIGICEDLGILTGYLVAAQTRVTDAYNLRRRRQGMSLAASMQWDLLPPMGIHFGQVHAAGMVEPAYDVGGDCFDYAVNGDHFDFCIMDSLGHGVGSAVTSALAIGSYRHGRRQGQTLEDLHDTLDSALAQQFGGERFVTGQLAQLELSTGSLRWLNAGHPLPLHIRGGRVIDMLQCRPSLPWGLGTSPASLASVSLEPGDSLLFYTDGVVEARGPDRVEFGPDRLADLVGRCASDQLPPRTIVRLLAQAVVDHHGNDLADDATVLLVQWDGP